MNEECRRETMLIDGKTFLETIENSLRKHRFCSECKLKVFDAFELLLDSPASKTIDRKGFSASLYEGLQSCPNEKHFHVETRRDLIKSFLGRAQTDIEHGRRERHAKTLDVAQEEILNSIGVFLFERFEKLSRTIRQEKRTSFWFFYISIESLRLSKKKKNKNQTFRFEFFVLF